MARRSAGYRGSSWRTRAESTQAFVPLRKLPIGALNEYSVGKIVREIKARRHNSLAAADARPFVGPPLPRLEPRDALRRAHGKFRPRAG